MRRVCAPLEAVCGRLWGVFSAPPGPPRSAPPCQYKDKSLPHRGSDWNRAECLHFSRKGGRA